LGMLKFWQVSVSFFCIDTWQPLKCKCSEKIYIVRLSNLHIVKCLIPFFYLFSVQFCIKISDI